jgi:uncharacterized protein RhaS with RHS repeats
MDYHPNTQNPRPSTTLSRVEPFYDAATGTFISVDPLATVTGDPYTYAAGNPTTFSDPSGLSYGCGANGCIDDSSSIYDQQFTAFINQDDDTNLTIAELRHDYSMLPEQRAIYVRDVVAGARKAFDLNHYENNAPFNASICEGSDLQCYSIVATAMAGVAAGPGFVARSVLGRLLARGARSAKDVAEYDSDLAVGQLTSGGQAKASELDNFGATQGWTRSQTENGPINYTDQNGVVRLTIKSGSPRAPGSSSPHVEIRNVDGIRIDPNGNPVTRTSPGNHTPIEWDLP